MRRLRIWWNVLVYGGTEGLAMNDPQRRVTIGVNLMSLSVGLLDITVGSFVSLITQRMNVLAGVFIELGLLTMPILFNRYKKYNLAGLSIFWIMSAATLFFGTILGPNINSQIMITYLIGVSLFMFSRLIYRALCVASSLAILILIEQNFRFNFIAPIEVSTQSAFILKWSAYVAMIILVLITFHLYWRNNLALRKELHAYAEKEAQENRQKDKFITNATHEMRVSFHGVLSIMSVLSNEVSKGKSTNELMQRANDLKGAFKECQTIADNILEFERYNAGIPSIKRDNLFNPQMVFSNIIEIYSYVARINNISISTWFSKRMPTHIQSDDVKIRHIFTNLLHNAIRYSPDNGTVFVKCNVTDRELIFSVRDNGDGIPGGMDIFAPFVSMNPDGLGIGLYVVKETIHVLNGTIKVESEKGCTIFTVAIPIKPIGSKVSETSLHS